MKVKFILLDITAIKKLIKVSYCKDKINKKLKSTATSQFECASNYKNIIVYNVYCKIKIMFKVELFKVLGKANKENIFYLDCF